MSRPIRAPSADPSNGVPVIPPFRVDPKAIPKDIGLTYFPGTDHSWGNTHIAWNQGQYDMWATVNGPITMSYMTRTDVPYHCALADAFTVGDAYHCSVMGPTNPNRTYLWTGCIGNLDNLGAGGTDGHGAGPMTFNGQSHNGAYWTFSTFPEVLQKAGISWKVYQDIAGQPFAPGLRRWHLQLIRRQLRRQLASSTSTSTPPHRPATRCSTTAHRHRNHQDHSRYGCARQDWQAWQETLFDQLRSDVKNGKLPQVSWIVAPAGYTEHSDWPVDYGAWYISQVVDILVSNPQVFSKTVLIVNYDEADGSFDHVTPPFPPQSADFGASTVDVHNEIVTTDTPNGPIGLGTRVPFLVISPWSKGGYVNSQVFDHTSVIQFIEKRFGVVENNISPWRRTVAGDLTSAFNFTNPNESRVHLPSTDGFLPPVNELAGGDVDTFIPTPSQVLIGLPKQEKGLRPSRALPYELVVNGHVNASNSTFGLDFINTGKAGAVFQVRSGNAADNVRAYTVEQGKQLSGTWKFTSKYDLSVYGPNGFARYYKGSVGRFAGILDVRTRYDKDDHGSVGLRITNVGTSKATVVVQDAYTGEHNLRLLSPGQSFESDQRCDRFFGWYDLVLKITEDPTFLWRFAGHVETGRDSYSDPALGGLVTLKA